MDPFRRQAYLDAMGVVAYRARRPLAGALASRPMPIRRTPAAAPTPASVAPRIVVEETRPELSHLSGPATPRSDAPPSIQPAQYRLQLAGNARLLVIAEMPRLDAQRDQAERLVANILWAVVPQEPYRQVFHWPLENLHPELDQGHDAARDTLQAVIQRLLPSQSVLGLLAMGQQAFDCLALSPSDSQWQSLPVITAIAPQDMLENVAAKRQLWLAIKTLLSRGEN